jgi:hypothetical protein
MPLVVCCSVKSRFPKQCVGCHASSPLLLAYFRGVGRAAQLCLSRRRLLRQDPHFCAHTGYAPTTSAGYNYAQHHSRPPTPPRRVDRDPRAGLGDGRKLCPCPRAALPEQDTIAPAYHRSKCRAGAGQLCEVWLRPVANIDANQRTLRFTTTNALDPIAGGNSADRFAITAASSDKNSSIRSSGLR